MNETSTLQDYILTSTLCVGYIWNNTEESSSKEV